jgi:hypothetical protein
MNQTSYPEKLPRVMADIIRRRWTPVDFGSMQPLRLGKKDQSMPTRRLSLHYLTSPSCETRCHLRQSGRIRRRRTDRGQIPCCFPRKERSSCESCNDSTVRERSLALDKTRLRHRCPKLPEYRLDSLPRAPRRLASDHGIRPGILIPNINAAAPSKCSDAGVMCATTRPTR